MIKEVSGDILLSGASALAHGVSPGDNFNQGLAHALREHWPAMYKDFRHFCHNDHPKSGGLWTWGGPEGVRIINLFTQKEAYDKGSKPGKATLDNVNHCLRALKQEIIKEKFTSVALPRIATGVGGLAWDEVRPMIESSLGDLSADIFLYSKYVPGLKASE